MELGGKNPALSKLDQKRLSQDIRQLTKKVRALSIRAPLTQAERQLPPSLPGCCLQATGLLSQMNQQLLRLRDKNQQLATESAVIYVQLACPLAEQPPTGDRRSTPAPQLPPPPAPEAARPPSDQSAQQQQPAQQLQHQRAEHGLQSSADVPAPPAEAPQVGDAVPRAGHVAATAEVAAAGEAAEALPADAAGGSKAAEQQAGAGSSAAPGGATDEADAGPSSSGSPSARGGPGQPSLASKPGVLEVQRDMALMCPFIQVRPAALSPNLPCHLPSHRHVGYLYHACLFLEVVSSRSGLLPLLACTRAPAACPQLF